jgi:acetyl-CoA acetyltransferase
VNGEVAVIGIGETPVGRVSEYDATQLYAMAARDAAEDAGIALGDIDALITGNSRSQPFMYHAESLAEYLGVEFRHCATVDTGGATTFEVMHQAAVEIAAGEYDTALVVMADSLLSGLGRDQTVNTLATLAHADWERPFGITIPGIYALMANRYMHDHGITPEQTAVACVNDRYHASLNPGAMFRDPLTVDDVLASKPIAAPLRLFDCAPVADGGCAVLLAGPGAAAGAPKPPVHVRGYGESYGPEHVSQNRSLAQTPGTESAAAAFEQAGIGRDQVDLAMIYDPFSFVQCLFLEDVGFCGRGEGADFIASGETRLGGSLPVNTHGGVLSYGHPGRPTALFCICEAVKQLRGEAEGRQVEGAEFALAHAEGGAMSTQATIILGGSAR